MDKGGSFLSRIFGRGKATGQTVSFEAKLAQLEKCGLRLTPPLTPEVLLRSFEREVFEREDYLFTLSCLASPEEEEPWRQLCSSAYSFDTECIYDEGDYSETLAILVSLADGALKLEGLKDELFIKVEEGESVEDYPARITFRCNGRAYEYNLTQQSDWFEPGCYSVLAALLAGTDSPLRYFIVDTGGQDALIGCLKPEQIAMLARLEGIELEVFDDRLPVDGLKEQ